MHPKRRALHGRTITAKKADAPHRKRHDYSNTIAESHVGPKMGASSFVRPNYESNTVTTTSAVATKSEAPPSSQPDDEAKKTEIPHDAATKTAETPPSSQLDDESVIKKAKSTIAAKMSDPDSVEFEQMERAEWKDALGKSIDSICGFVKDKKSGAKPFLYVVQRNEAYIGGYIIATSEYRNICSIAASPNR